MRGFWSSPVGSSLGRDATALMALSLSPFHQTRKPTESVYGPASTDLTVSLYFSFETALLDFSS